MRVLRHLYPNSTQTGTGSDSAFGREGRDISEARGPIEVFVLVTASSGTSPTLVVNVDDGFYVQRTMGAASSVSGYQYRSSIITSPPTITGNGLYLNGTLNDYGTALRVNWTIGGTTPSFSFEVWLL